MPKLLLLIIIYPMLFILYFIMKHTIHHPQNLYFGVTLSDELLQDYRLPKITNQYYKRLLRTTILSGLFSSLIFLPSSSSISVTLLYLWIFLTIVAICFPYAQANIALKEMKLQINNKLASLKTSKKNQKTLNLGKGNIPVYCILLIVTFLPLLYVLLHLGETRNSYNIRIVLIALNLINLLILWFSIATARQHVVMLSNKPQLNMELDIMKKRLWQNTWLILALMNTVYTYIVFLFFQQLLTHYLLFLLLTYLYLAVGIYLLVKCPQSIHKLQVQKLQQNAGAEALLDEDDLWVWGMFYHNTKDKKLFIKSRFHSLYAINHAKFSGRILNLGFIFLWFCGLCLCIWSIFIEYTPLQLSLDHNQIVVTQLREEYTIDLDEIKSIELLEDLPFQLVHNEFNSVCKGKFKVAPYDSYTLFLDPTNTYFIYINTDHGGYLLSTSNDEDTVLFYDQLLNTIN